VALPRVRPRFEDVVQPASTSSERPLLVHDFVYVDQPMALVIQRLRADAAALFTSVTDGARHDEQEARLRVGPLGEAPLLSRTVRVTCAEGVQSGDTFILPLTWTAERMAAAFPVMQADLEIAPFGDDRTQITLMGRYEPPLGSVGRGLDRLLLHRLAQATVRAFLARLRLRLDEVP
jgi:hypothetical protein